MIFEIFIGVVVLVLALIGYALYTAVIKNALLRRHYSKYENVYLNPEASYIKGDLQYMIDHYLSKGGHIGEACVDYFKKDPKKDFIFITLGASNLQACSPEAISELLTMIPSKIDRATVLRMFSRVFPKSSYVNGSTPQWKSNRDNTGKSI